MHERVLEPHEQVGRERRHARVAALEARDSHADFGAERGAVHAEVRQHAREIAALGFGEREQPVLDFDHEMRFAQALLRGAFEGFARFALEARNKRLEIERHGPLRP